MYALMLALLVLCAVALATFAALVGYVVPQILFSRRVRGGNRGEGRGEKSSSGALSTVSLASAASNGVLSLELFGRAVLDPEILARANETAGGAGTSVLVWVVLGCDAALLLGWVVTALATPGVRRLARLARIAPKRIRDEVYWIRNRKEILRRLEDIDQQLRRVERDPSEERDEVAAEERG